ncbi:2-polyprenyl-6-methoxyphenol hydroxylase [Bradyrhizobium rifense]|uniref:2-polyprenyl-6-methoxyphenol hydroxylase n=2 Tax=Bradyrhizobium rifense TaxID=515499 RepID=A0A5D3KNH3_9BRAD|nr:2-polyprenyl-6-methoxyphenol hydroxylase [Bradyrhizobium rifense]
MRDAGLYDADVLVVGAGPVGQTLAIDLAKRGVSVVLIERNRTCLQHPKMERCNARTMEFYRRLGLATRIRAASRFQDIPMDVFIATHLRGKKIFQLPYPSVAAMQEAGRRCNDGTLPLEPYQLISQYTLEPLLKSVVESLPKADVRFGCELISFSQDAAGVDADVKSTDGTTSRIRTRYMVGCDGGSSTVRKQLGVKLEGRGRIAQQRQIFFRSEALFSRLPFGPGRHYHFPFGMLVVQDDLRHFMANTGSIEGPTPAVLLQEMFRIDFPFEVQNVTLWHQNLLVAERYSDRRVFLAGDAVHLVIPTGGLGMNTGVGDAIDLSWKLAGTLAGWGGPNLLSSYELERRPVGLHNRDVSGRAAAGVNSWRAACRPEIDSDTPEGEANRNEVARLAAIGQRLSHEMIGTELGYSYAGSPLIGSDDEPPPTQVDDHYQPTTRPGSRLPHVWLDDGQALHDRIGNEFTLVSLGRDQSALPALRQSFAEFGAKLDIVQVESKPAREVYGHDLVLVRPDLHVVWRGNSLPADLRAIATVATGHT